jgi:membrane associated rhomboid family serine protease
MSYTLIIIAITVLVSLAAFSSTELYNKLILWPAHMHNNPAEYHRLISSGFIHADYSHLLFNMFTLYSFGQFVELYFQELNIHNLYLVLYLSGIVVASFPSFWKHRNNSYYRSLGASGGVAAVIFSSVYFEPWARIYGFIPSIVFAVIYLIYCAYSSRRGGSNINHDAHFWGSVYGFVFTLIFDPSHGQIFIYQLQHGSF